MKTPYEGNIGDGRFRMVLPVAGWPLLAILCACGADSGHESGHQVIAKVNGDEITVGELNDRFSRIEARSGLDAKVRKQQVLDALVDEKLLVQGAMGHELDQDPAVRHAMERATRQILVQAEIERAGMAAGVSANEARAFYAGHPHLFQQRRIYIFRRMWLEQSVLDASLKRKLDDAKTPGQVASILEKAGIRFFGQTDIRAAEALPMEILERAAGMAEGDILALDDAGRILLMQLTDSIAEPIEFERAAPSIQAYLTRNAALDFLKDLRKQARIEYGGTGTMVTAVPITASVSDSVRPSVGAKGSATTPDFASTGIPGGKP